MRAVGYQCPGNLDRPESLVDIDLPVPVATGRDLLVEVKAVSVNPVDTKVRRSMVPEPGAWKVLGWDASGIVTAAGPNATLFRPGDEVFYAGALGRSGTNAQFHLVDERIVGLKPRTLDWAQAAALPLTAVTAWETLFDRLRIGSPVPGAANTIVIIGGAGGVGSVCIQLLRALTDVTVIATASRPQTREWALALGAHYVIDHSLPLAAQVAALRLGAPGFVFSTTHTDQHVGGVIELIAPQGRFALIDDPPALDVVPFKRKSVSIHWELMFTRTLFDTVDQAEQGRLLGEVSRLVDAGDIRTTLTERRAPINAANLRAAHAQLESHGTQGKLVLEGW